jgi:cell division septation protein DedD
MGMNKGKGPGTRMKAGRILVSYGIVFFIGLWLGYRFASTGKTVAPERKEMSESVVKMENEDQGKRERREGNDRKREASSFEGEGVQRDDLSLSFYETLLKKEQSPKMHSKRGNSGGTQATTGKEKRESPLKEDKSSKRDLSGVAPYSIQVGSFAHKKQAENLTQFLRGKGYPAYITSQIISEMGRMYQVRIGHYRTLDEAKREAKLIGRKEKLPTYIPSSPDR